MFSVRLKSKKADKAQGEAAAPPAKDAINIKRDREAARSRLKSIQAREIGPLPAVVDPKRRESCRPSLELFCLTYIRPAFPLPFSPGHRKAIEKLERAIIHGGLFAFAMPRGQGKTTLAVAAAIWALLYGYRRFVVLIGATEGHAEKLLDRIKASLTSDLIVADFPEICLPLKLLENDARRCTGQILDGVKTQITWKRKMVVLPAVAGSAASGSVVSVCGITGAIRGQNHALPNGEIIRPDLVIPDDPQTQKSAWSESQCETRLSILNGDILGLAGPGRKIAAVCPCTVIRKGDMADVLLDRKLNPDWQGERTRMMISLPTNEKRWEEYGQIRADSLGRDGDGSEATEYYRQHREEMDAGAVAAWPERYNPDEISAIQNAMNLKLRNEDAFLAEAQNEPREAKVDVTQLKPEELITRLSNLPRGTVPTRAQKITAMIDVQDKLLYWAICAWEAESFEGWVIDYGTFPEQPRRYFTLRQAAPTLSTLYPGVTTEAAIRKGLDALKAELKARKFKCGSAELTLDKGLIDRGYKPDIVNQAIRAGNDGNLFMPAKGVGIGASSRPMNEYKRQPGELIGHNWMIPKPVDGEIRHVRHDTNHWKTFLHNRLALPIGTKGAITLYGAKSQEHRLLGDHLTAETGIPTEGQGRQLVEWRRKPGGPDNHFLDCLVGCAVAASRSDAGRLRMTSPRCNAGEAPGPRST